MTITQQAQLSGRVAFTYPNPKGGIKERDVTVRELQYGTTKYHKEPTWLLHGYCHTKKAPRVFDLMQMSGLKSVIIEKTLSNLAYQAGIPYQDFASQVMNYVVQIAKVHIEHSGQEGFSVVMERDKELVKLTVEVGITEETKH